MTDSIRADDVVIDLVLHDAIPVVSLAAEIDIANVAILERYLEEATSGAPALVISLERCRYIDSSGLRLLLRRAATLGERFAVVALPGSQARRIIDLTGLGTQFGVCDSQAAALDRVVRAVTVA